MRFIHQFKSKDQITRQKIGPLTRLKTCTTAQRQCFTVVNFRITDFDAIDKRSVQGVAIGNVPFVIKKTAGDFAGVGRAAWLCVCVCVCVAGMGLVGEIV